MKTVKFQFGDKTYIRTRKTKFGAVVDSLGAFVFGAVATWIFCILVLL